MFNYLLLFLLNLSIELSVSYLFKYRKFINIFGVVAVNGITHPIFMIVLNKVYSYNRWTIVIILLLELVVVISEWKLLEFMFKNKDLKLLYLSIAMNTTSYIIGLLLNI